MRRSSLQSPLQKKESHFTPLLLKWHWLPISQRIEYKLSVICYNIISETAPLYLSDFVQLYTPSRSLRSSTGTRLFRIPRWNKTFPGQRAFSYLGPDTWNQLPFSVRHSSTAAQFKRTLKPDLFRKAYSAWETKVLICVNCEIVALVWMCALARARVRVCIHVVHFDSCYSVLSLTWWIIM